MFLDGALCLGTPLALWIELKSRFTVESVLDMAIRNFLIGNSLVELGEPWPHGERSHGAAGILEHLRELFGSAQPIMAATFLEAMAMGSVTKHSPCPCRSGRKLLKCHRDGFNKLRRVPSEVLKLTAELILAEVDFAHRAA